MKVKLTITLKKYVIICEGYKCCNKHFHFTLSLDDVLALAYYIFSYIGYAFYNFSKIDITPNIFLCVSFGISNLFI